METICSSEMLADFHQTKRRYIPEDRTPHSYCCCNVNNVTHKCYKLLSKALWAGRTYGTLLLEPGKVIAESHQLFVALIVLSQWRFSIIQL
jgi:hypothetical protein